MARQDGPKTPRIENVPLNKIRGSICAWVDCRLTFESDMPKGWRHLLVWWSPRPSLRQKIVTVAFSPDCDRDAVLCPEHALQLESQLKNIMRDTGGASAGSA